MLDAVNARINRVRTVVSRATATPLLVRCAIAVCGMLAVSVALPVQLLGSQLALLVLVVAVLPACLPRGRSATVLVVLVVGGWILDTTVYGRPVVLWRLLALASLLYFLHTLSALAAALPYDAVVRSDVVAWWVARAFAVVLASAVLTIVVLALTTALAGGALLAATLVGVAAAIALAVLLSRLLRRA